MLTAERLREVLSYDPDTGIWTWRVRLSSRSPKGGRAGSMDSHGYWRIKVDKKEYTASRLAWLYVTGEWPENNVDHKNCVRSDDRWPNLREATQAQNGSNRGSSRVNTSGFKGVSWHKASRKWQACIQARGVQIHLGVFDDPRDASAAYRAASQREHGEFAREA